jgi:hypothetical protein
MSWWSRIAYVFREERLGREIDEEIESHIEEAVKQGRDPAEARPAFGSALRLREESRDVRLITWLDYTDLTYGSDDEMEKANRQYVSGWMFSTLGLQPALGRLLNKKSDFVFFHEQTPPPRRTTR